MKAFFGPRYHGYSWRWMIFVYILIFVYDRLIWSEDKEARSTTLDIANASSSGIIIMIHWHISSWNTRDILRLELVAPNDDFQLNTPNWFQQTSHQKRRERDRYRPEWQRCLQQYSFAVLPVSLYRSSKRTKFAIKAMSIALSFFMKKQQCTIYRSLDSFLIWLDVMFHELTLSRQWFNNAWVWSPTVAFVTM